MAGSGSAMWGGHFFWHVTARNANEVGNGNRFICSRMSGVDSREISLFWQIGWERFARESLTVFRLL